MEEPKLSEMDIFREVLMVASTRGTEDCDPAEDRLTFLNIIDSFDTVVTTTGIDKELQTVCYQAILLMSSDSTKHWTDKLTAPEPYMRMKQKRVKTSLSSLSAVTTTAYLTSDQEKSKSTSDDLARLNKYMSRSLLHSTGYGSPVKTGTVPVSSSSSGQAAYSPLNNYFEAKEGAQIAPSYSQSRMWLNHHHHTPAREEYEGAASGANSLETGDQEYIRTYQGRAVASVGSQSKALKKFSDGLNHADSQTLESLTRRLYDLDKDRLADTEYRVGQKGALLMSRYKEKSSLSSSSPPPSKPRPRPRHTSAWNQGTPGGAETPDPGVFSPGTSSTMRLEDLDEGVSLSLALNKSMVPAALRVGHGLAMERLGYGCASDERGAGAPLAPGCREAEGSGERVAQAGHDMQVQDQPDSQGRTDEQESERSLRLDDLVGPPAHVHPSDSSSGDNSAPIGPMGAVYDYQPGMATNTVNNRGGQDKARSFQSPSLATNRAYADKYGPALSNNDASVAVAVTGGSGVKRVYAEPLDEKAVAPSAHTTAHKDILAKALEVAERADQVFRTKSEFVDPNTAVVKRQYGRILGAKRTGETKKRDETVSASAGVPGTGPEREGNGEAEGVGEAPPPSLLSQGQEQQQAAYGYANPIGLSASDSSVSSLRAQRAMEIMAISTAPRTTPATASGDVERGGAIASGDFLSRSPSLTGIAGPEPFSMAALRSKLNPGRFQQRINMYSGNDAANLVSIVNKIDGLRSSSSYSPGTTTAEKNESRKPFSVLASTRAPYAGSNEDGEKKEGASVQAASIAGLSSELFNQMTMRPERAFRDDETGVVVLESLRESNSPPAPVSLGEGEQGGAETVVPPAPVSLGEGEQGGAETVVPPGPAPTSAAFESGEGGKVVAVDTNKRLLQEHMRHLEQEEEAIMGASSTPSAHSPDLLLGKPSPSSEASPGADGGGSGASPSAGDVGSQVSDLEPFEEYSERVKATDPAFAAAEPVSQEDLERWPAYLGDDENISVPESLLSEACVDDSASESDGGLMREIESASPSLSQSGARIELRRSNDQDRGLVMPSDILHDLVGDDGVDDNQTPHRKVEPEPEGTSRPDSPELTRSGHPVSRGTRTGGGSNPASPDTNIRDVLNLDIDDDDDDDLIEGNGFGLDRTGNSFSTSDEEEEGEEDEDTTTDAVVYITTAEELSGPGSTLETRNSTSTPPEAEGNSAGEAGLIETREEEEEEEEDENEFVPSWAVPVDEATLADEEEDMEIMAVAKAAVGVGVEEVNVPASVASTGNTTLPSIESSKRLLATAPVFQYSPHTISSVSPASTPAPAATSAWAGDRDAREVVLDAVVLPPLPPAAEAPPTPLPTEASHRNVGDTPSRPVSQMGVGEEESGALTPTQARLAVEDHPGSSQRRPLPPLDHPMPSLSLEEDEDIEENGGSLGAFVVGLESRRRSLKPSLAPPVPLEPTPAEALQEVVPPAEKPAVVEYDSGLSVVALKKKEVEAQAHASAVRGEIDHKEEDIMTHIPEDEAQEPLRVPQDSGEKQYPDKGGDSEEEEGHHPIQPASASAPGPLTFAPRTPVSLLFDTTTSSKEEGWGGEGEKDGDDSVPGSPARVGWVVDEHGNSRLGPVPAAQSDLDENEEEGDEKEGMPSWASVSDKVTASTTLGSSRRRSSAQLDSARSFILTSSASAKAEDGSTRKRRMTLQQHQIKREKGKFMDTGDDDDWHKYHAFGSNDEDGDEDPDYHQHTMHWVPVYETLTHSEQSRTLVIKNSVQVECRMSHARTLCIFARWITHRQDMVAQHFEVMDHRKGLFDDAVDDNNDANRSRFATRFRGGDLSLAAPTSGTSTLRSRFMFSLTEEGDDDERDPLRYEWDVNEDDFGTLGVHTPSSSTAELFGRKTDSLSRVEGYDDDSAPRSYNSSIALAYYHRLTGGGAADAVDKNARHFGTYVPSTDLDEEEAYLRYRLIEHCSFRAMQDVFHALCVYTGAKHATKSMKHHLRYMKRVGFVQFQGALMKPKLRERRSHVNKELTYSHFHGEEYTDDEGNAHFSPHPYASRVLTFNDYYFAQQENAVLLASSQASGLQFEEQRAKAARRRSMQVLQTAQSNGMDLLRERVDMSASASVEGISSSNSSSKRPSLDVFGGTPMKRRGTILDRIFSSGPATSPPPVPGRAFAGGVGRMKGGVPSVNKLLELHKKSMAGEKGGGALLHHHSHLSLPNSAMPAYLQREKWSEILGISLHHKRLSSTRYYLIQMTGGDYIHQVNQISLYMLFMLRRLHRRTIGHRRQAHVVELTDQHRLRNVMTWLYDGMVQGKMDDEMKIQIAEAHQITFMTEKVLHAFKKLKRLSHVLSQEELFYRTLSHGIRSKPHILRAARLIHNRYMVWFMDILKIIYYKAEITPQEAANAHAHYLRGAMRRAVLKWYTWTRGTSRQRVSPKNYSYHHHVLLRNRRLALYKRVLRRENGEREVDWFSHTSYVLGHDDGASEPQADAKNGKQGLEGVSSSVTVKFLRRRVTVQDVVDVTIRMHLYRALRVLHQWARIRRLYFSQSDAIFSSYSVTALPAHGPLSLSAPGRVKAIANDNIACVKLRHMAQQSRAGVPGDARKASVLPPTSLGSCRERCAALSIPLVSYHPNPLVLEKVYSRSGGRGLGSTVAATEGKVLTQHEQHIKSLQLQTLAPMREAYVVSFYPRSNTHRFRLRPFNLDDALSDPVPLPSDTAVEYDETERGGGERVIAVQGSAEEDAEEGETIAGVATIRRGLVRARRKQQEAHHSKYSSMLSKKLCPPSIIEGGIIEVEYPDHHYREGHHDRHDGETYREHHQHLIKRTRMSFLASGPILLAYLKHWLYQSRVDRRLKALSHSLRSRLDAKMMRWSWDVMCLYRCAQVKERTTLVKLGITRLVRRALVLSHRREDIETANRHWKYVWMRRLFNNCAHLSFSTLNSARTYMAKVRDSVEKKVVTETELGSTIELSRDMILKMHGGRAIARIQSNPCLRARIRTIFYKASGNRTGSEFSLLESTFGEAGLTTSATLSAASSTRNTGDSRGRDSDGGLLHGTGYDARQHAVHTAKLVSVALGRHAHSRTLLLRLVRKVRRRIQHRETLVPTIRKEQRNALRFLYYSQKVKERALRCQLLSLRRPLKNWRFAVVSQWTRKSLARFCMKHIAASNKELKEARNWLRPFVETVVMRKCKSAFKHWLSKQEFVMTLHDKLKVDMHTRTMKMAFSRIRALQRAKRHRQKILKTDCFQAMQTWLGMSVVEDCTRRALRKWQWRNSRSMQSRETTREDTHMRLSLLQRGLSALSVLISAPSLRFRRVFLVTAMKLVESPVYAEYYRDKVVQRMRRELNRFRQTDVAKGELLKCLSHKALLNQASTWIVPPKLPPRRDLSFMSPYINELADLQSKAVNDEGQSTGGSPLDGEEAPRTPGSGTEGEEEEADGTDSSLKDGVTEGASGGSTREGGDEDIGFVPSWPGPAGVEDDGIQLARTDGITTLRGPQSVGDYYVRRLEASLGHSSNTGMQKGPIATDVTHRTERVMLVTRLGSIVGGHLNSHKLRDAVSRLAIACHYHRVHVPSLMARHRHSTRKRAALSKLHAYAIERATARSYAIKNLYKRSLELAIQRQNFVQSEALLCETAGEYYNERTRRMAVQHIRVQTLKNRLAQRNNSMAVSTSKNRRLALALVLWQVSCGERIQRPEEEESEVDEDEDEENQHTINRGSETSPGREAFGTSRMSKSEIRRERAGFTNW